MGAFMRMFAALEEVSISNASFEGAPKMFLADFVQNVRSLEFRNCKLDS